MIGNSEDKAGDTLKVSTSWCGLSLININTQLKDAPGWGPGWVNIIESHHQRGEIFSMK